MILKKTNNLNSSGYLFEGTVMVLGYKFYVPNNKLDSFYSNQMYYNIGIMTNYLEVTNFIFDYLSEYFFSIRFLHDTFISTEDED
jgi:sulfatase maturation enzyme AslB (radical SAM superfamily)